MKSSAKILGFILLVYLITGIGVWIQESINQSRSVKRQFASALAMQKDQDQRCKLKTEDVYCGSQIAFSEGPSSSLIVIPLLPGVAIVKSRFQVGPTWGAASNEIVVWYGFGLVVVNSYGGYVS